MKSLLLFCFLVLASANAVPASTPSNLWCPDGFSVLNNNTCIKLIETARLYQAALDDCKTYTGGNLVSIVNQNDNQALLNLALSKGSVRPIWLGLTCNNTNQYSCRWSDGFWNTYYFNFVNGNPLPDVGTNVYMLTSGSSASKWVSADGTLVSLSYICEVPTNSAPNTCPNEFNECCYTVNQNLPLVNEAQAREYCQRQCGDLVSIHSNDENYFVMSLFNSSISQLRIGARTDGIGKYWVDASYFDYNNFGYFNADVGKCSAIQGNNGILQPGQWLSNDCEDNIPFVCKRLKDLASCSPTPGPTFNPNQCYGNHFFTGNGTINSPNYPNSYFGTGSPCTYIFTVPSGQIAQVQFPRVILDPQSTLSLYSGIEGTEAIIQLTGSVYTSPPFSSATNVIKMVFENGESKYDSTTKWTANYGYNLSPNKLF